MFNFLTDSRSFPCPVDSNIAYSRGKWAEQMIHQDNSIFKTEKSVCKCTVKDIESYTPVLTAVISGEECETEIEVCKGFHLLYIHCIILIFQEHQFTFTILKTKF